MSWEVTPKGGYITRLSHNGIDLLFPDTVINGTRRGGAFVTVPQFGPDNPAKKIMLEQHGFARKSDWHVGRVAAAGVSLSHERQRGPYAGLCTSLSYRFNRAPNDKTAFYAGLTLYNDSNKIMRISPGFHPYIDISRLGEDRLEETQRELADSPTVPASQATLVVSDDSEVHIETRGFERMTWWTDMLGKYVCIEPSLAGDSFSKHPKDPLDIEILEPGGIREFDVNMTWRPRHKQAFLRNQPSLRR